MGQRPGVSRRDWLVGALAAGLCAAGRADEPTPADAEEQRERQALVALGARAGLKPFRSSRTSHFLGLGDARDDFRELTLRDCEMIAADYLHHYRTKGFDVGYPERRLTVVTLADDRSFAAFLVSRDLVLIARTHPDPSIHGVYDQGTNRLVVFDHRTLGRQLAPRPGHDNLQFLAHEVTHQLTFNSGLLARRGDVPACIVEGLAMYGEVRRLGGRNPPGQVNHSRLDDLAHCQRRRIPWIPASDLLADDRHLGGTVASFEALLAHAESWLLLDYLMRGPSKLPGFRGYLGALREGADPARRLDLARAHLGDLDRLDQDLRAYSIRMQKSR